MKAIDIVLKILKCQLLHIRQSIGTYGTTPELMQEYAFTLKQIHIIQGE